MKRVAVALALTFAALLPASAGADVLYDQTATLDTSHGAYSKQGSAQSADDFTVPAGTSWTLDSAAVNGDTSSGSTMTVFIYLDSQGFPGPQFASRAGLSIPFFSPTPGLETFPLSGLVVPPGHYWLSAQAVGTTGWDWSPATPIRGQQAAYMTTSAGACQNHWGRLGPAPAGCGLASGAPPSDLSFELLGSASSTLPAAAHKCRKKKKKHHSAVAAKKKHKKCKKKKHH